MGYHVIVKNDADGLDARYLESLAQLAFLPRLTADTVIYQGEPHWTPMRLGDHPEGRNYLSDEFRAGLQAQDLFRRLAISQGFAAEAIAQDRESFRAYTDQVAVPIKRGDFLLRNAGHIEIEVKCLTCYAAPDGGRFFYLGYHAAKKHRNMEDFLHSPVVLAIFERDGPAPLEDTLRMVAVRTLFAENGKTVHYDKDAKALRIPVDLMRPGFALIEDQRKPGDGPAR